MGIKRKLQFKVEFKSVKDLHINALYHKKGFIALVRDHCFIGKKFIKMYKPQEGDKYEITIRKVKK